MSDFRLYLEGFGWTVLIGFWVTIATVIIGKVFPPIFNHSNTLAIIGIVLSKIVTVSIEDSLRYFGLSRMRRRYTLGASAFIVALYIALIENVQQFFRVRDGLAESGEMMNASLLVAIFIVIGVARLLLHFVFGKYYVLFADKRLWGGVAFLFVLHVTTNVVLAILPFFADSLAQTVVWACASFVLASGLAFTVCRKWFGRSARSTTPT